jgi:glycosyltransferase involved in cell wall biosynthesis
MLRQLQVRSFKKADGVIFLTKYARDTISQWLEQVQNLNALIPHGIEPRFAADVNSQLSVENYSLEKPFTFLYVSILMPYKHQIEVARAASLLRGAGCPLRMKFIGMAWGSYGRQFRKILTELDPKNEFLIWDGGVSFDSIHSYYKESNAFVFASSCENLPNILIEAMANGLPIVCSNCGPMPEVLKDAGIYFDPSKPQDIAKAMSVLINNSSLRERIAFLAKKQSLLYSWERCAKDTFEFIEAVAASRAANNLSKNLS